MPSRIVAAVALEADAIEDHMQPRFVITAGVAWRLALDDEGALRRRGRPRRARVSWRGDSLPPMKLVSYRAPGGEALHGEVRDGRVAAFDDGSTVKDRLASGYCTPAGVASTRSATSSCWLLTCRERSSASASTTSRNAKREHKAEPPEALIVFM